MILKIRPYLLLMLMSVLFYSCQKEYSLEGNLTGGTAVFTLDGAPGNCTNALVTGNYFPGAALGASNVVTISVNVVTVGTYTISTDTENGFSFSGSGTFTTAGPQTITMVASGIPIAPGTFSFLAGTSSCAFLVTVTGGSGGTAVYTLAGAPGACTSFTPGGTYTVGTPLASSNFASVTVNVTTIGTYSLSTNNLNGISFSKSGTFTTTGNQVVQLSGTGTPLAAGTFNYTAGTSGCSFPITVTGGAGSAVFTYPGAPGNCTTATPAGTYTAGTALTATNTVAIGVNVTTAGTYTISTPVVNGISFSGSGSFAATGPQTVTLTGSGTPTAAGPFTYTPTNGCAFPITVIAGPAVTDFFKCTIDGVAKTFNVSLVGDLFDPNTFTIDGDETTAGTTAAFGLEIAKPTGISTGVYNRYSATNTTNYALGGYIDNVTGTSIWISGVAPTAAPFSVTVTSFTATRIDGTFTGTIYSDPVLATGPKVITNGQFSVSY